MTRDGATAAISGATRRDRGGLGARVPEALGKALQGRAFGPLTIVVPGIAFGSQDRRSGTFAVPVPPGRRLRVGACPGVMAARGALPLQPVLDGADAAPRYRLKEGAGKGVSSSAAIALLNRFTNIES